MISGFTVARNVVDLGYPLIESVCSALPICDEFIISEGYSSDRTWEVVQALAERFPEKVKVRRDPWSDAPDNGKVIARISNRALADCRSDYCLYLQANEVLHEKSLKVFASLPGRYPDDELFTLPFCTILGHDRLWLVQHRNRLFKRTRNLCITGDGYDAGYFQQPAKVAGLFYRATRRWQRLKFRFGIPEQVVYRYRALCPANYLNKIKTRREMTRAGVYRDQWNEEWAAASRAAGVAEQDPQVFWKLMAPFFSRRSRARTDMDIRPEYSVAAMQFINGPAIMDGIGGTWHYSLDQSLQRLANQPL